MTLFFRRFIGALVLDAGIYEEIEADRRSAMHSVIVVIAVCIAGGVATLGLDAASPGAFAAGAIVSLGAWLLWASFITTIGIIALPERQTRNDLPELLRVLGFAAAPGVFIALAALRPAAPIVLVVVAAWMIAAAVLAVRQALDYRSTRRAIAVCLLGWMAAFGIVGAVLMLFTQRVS